MVVYGVLLRSLVPLVYGGDTLTFRNAAHAEVWDVGLRLPVLLRCDKIAVCLAEILACDLQLAWLCALVAEEGGVFCEFLWHLIR